MQARVGLCVHVVSSFLFLTRYIQQNYIGDAFEVSRWSGSRYTKTTTCSSECRKDHYNVENSGQSKLIFLLMFNQKLVFVKVLELVKLDPK